MTEFTRTHVGYTNNDRKLFEYALEGTSLVVTRTYPDRGEGWSVYDEATNMTIVDMWHLSVAKQYAINRADEYRRNFSTVEERGL